VQVAPNKPPVQPDQISGREKRLESKVKFLELENELLRKKLEPDALTQTDVNNFQAAMKQIAPSLRKCKLGSAADEMSLTVELRDGGFKLGIQPDVGVATVDCADKLISKIDFGSVKKGAYTYAVTFEAPVVVRTSPPPNPPKPPVTVVPTPPVECADTNLIDDLERKGDKMMSEGAYAAALATFDKVLKCRPRPVNKAYLAACKSRSFPRAKVLFKQIGKESLAQICLKEGFDPRTP
jgi:hypothetical protein